MADDKLVVLEHDSLLRYATEIVSAYVGRNEIPGSQVPDLINTVFASLRDLNGGDVSSAGKSKQKPAVSIRRSITPDYIICLEDGKNLKMLKRYLRTNYGMTPEEYRVKWGLPHDYPMVAPNYARQRSDFAKNIGLGKGRKSSRGSAR